MQIQYTTANLSSVDLGRQGENLARTIAFDVSDMLTEWPDARIDLAVRRKYDSEPYLAETKLEGNVLYWPITSVDTEYPGNGYLEIRAYSGDVLAKSVVGNTIVQQSLTGGHTKPPDPDKWWVDQVREATDNANASAGEAAEAAGRADGAANLASTAAGNANTAANKADTAAGKADTAAANADTAASKANAAAGNAAAMADAAKTAADRADAAAADASEAAQKALDAAENAAAGGGGGAMDAATEAGISDRSSDAGVIVPGNLDYAVKAAMCDGRGPEWTEAEKAAVRKRIGVKSTASDVYSSMSQIASIVRTNSVEDNARIFPIGDQIIAPWKDMDDPAHNTDATAYQVEWDIVHHGLVTLKDGSVVPGMFLMMHKCIPYGVQFSHQQAFYQAAKELPAGTYHVNFGVKFNNTFTAGTSGQFTLAGAVPAGGRLCFDGAKVQVFTTAESAAAAETVAMTIGNAGTDLGTVSPNRVPSDTGLNAMHQILYGHNRWSTSGIRQYLNASGTNWFSSKEDFDIRPDQYNKQGFMSGFGDDFLSAIKPVKVTTALNTVEGFTDATEDTFDTFFLPSLEQINATPQLRGAEGDYFEYWRRRLGLSGFAAYHPTIYDGYKIPAINANSPQNVRLRSAHRGNAYGAWIVHSSGYVANYYASYAYRFSPVCVIC